jgi:hypothetical protein
MDQRQFADRVGSSIFTTTKIVASGPVSDFAIALDGVALLDQREGKI